LTSAIRAILPIFGARSEPIKIATPSALPHRFLQLMRRDVAWRKMRDLPLLLLYDFGENCQRAVYSYS